MEMVMPLSALNQEMQRERERERERERKMMMCAEAEVRETQEQGNRSRCSGTERYMKSGESATSNRSGGGLPVLTPVYSLI